MTEQQLKPGEILNFQVDLEKEGMRLDQWMAELLQTDASRSLVQKWIRNGYVSGPIEHIKSSQKVAAGEIFAVTIPQIEPLDFVPVDMHIRILYEDDDLAVIIKPPGIAVHPGPGERRETLINGLLYIWKNLTQTGESFRPGIVHRLDKPTEGLLIIAKHERALRQLSAAFRKNEIEKTYYAWLLQTPLQGVATIDRPIKRHPRERMKMRIDATGRKAVTHYWIEKTITTHLGKKFSFAKIMIETGRTHQIRVHMSSIGCPIVGDDLYSRSSAKYEKFGMLLLAGKLKFKHPFQDREMEFVLDIPERFHEFEKAAVRY